MGYSPGLIKNFNLTGYCTVRDPWEPNLPINLYRPYRHPFDQVDGHKTREGVSGAPGDGV